MNTIFRKQSFVCGGCGKTREVKLNVPAPKARDAIAPPRDWYEVSFSRQCKKLGAIVAIAVYACTQACAEQAQRGEGASGALVKGFDALLPAPGQEAPPPAGPTNPSDACCP